jgi:hypothetical protein
MSDSAPAQELLEELPQWIIYPPRRGRMTGPELNNMKLKGGAWDEKRVVVTAGFQEWMPATVHQNGIGLRVLNDG